MENSSSKIVLLGLFLGSFFLSGCAKYRPMSLLPATGITQEKDGIVVTTTKLSKKENDVIFDKKLSSPKLQPIQIMVENKGKEPIELCSSRIGLDLKSRINLENEAHYNEVGRMFWLGFLGYMSASKTNKKMDKHFEQTILADDATLTIWPMKIINKIMFISSYECPKAYDISFVNMMTHQVTTFNCAL